MAAKIKRDTILKLAALVCVCGLLGDQLILTPMMRTWDARTRRIRELKLALGKEQALLAQKEHWRELWVREQKKLLPNRLADAEGMVLESLNRWAKESGVRITSLRPHGRQALADFRTVEIQAAAVGNMNAVARFLYALETAPMALAVEDLELAAAKQGGDNLTVNLRLTGLATPDKGAAPAGRGT